MMWLVATIVIIGLFILWGYFLKEMADKGKTGVFTALFVIPYGLILAGTVYVLWQSIIAMTLPLAILALAVLGIFAGQAITLYEAGSRRQIGAFWTVFILFHVFALTWVLYWAFNYKRK